MAETNAQQPIANGDGGGGDNNEDDDADIIHDAEAVGDGKRPTEDFIEGMIHIKGEKSELTKEQRMERDRLVPAIYKEFRKQDDKEDNRNMLRSRDQFLHAHGTQGNDRVVDAVVVLKCMQMLRQGMKVCVLNLNFLKRLQTCALFHFLKNYAMTTSEDLRKLRGSKVFLSISEEDPDDLNIRVMMDVLNDHAEDWPLFVMTDETCKEAERIDDAINDLTKLNERFHFWTASLYAHGCPDMAERHRLDLKYDFPPAIRQVMDMIDIDDDDLYDGGHQKVPLRRVVEPFPTEGPDFNLREHLDRLKVFLIGHDKNHIDADVWDCPKCGDILGDYLRKTIELGKPGLENNEIFIVGHLERFESKVDISGMQKALMRKDIEFGASFCRRAVHIEDILSTMKGVVVADHISMRGVDKKMAIIIPNPRDPEKQRRVLQEMRRKEEREKREKNDDVIADQEITEEDPEYKKPRNPTDVLLFLRPLSRGEVMDGIEEYRAKREKAAEGKEGKGEKKKKKGGGGGGKDKEEHMSDDEELSEDEMEEPMRVPMKPEEEDIFFSQAAHQSMLRRAINSMSRSDKDMILDVLTDAPRHAVLFHFAEDEFMTDKSLA